MYEYTPEQLYDALDIVEQAIEAAQQMRYGNSHIARRKLMDIALVAARLANSLPNGTLTLVDDEDDGE